MPFAWPLFLLLLQAPAAADQPIRNFLKVSPEFCTGGQPRPEHFARLKADGVKTVLNLPIFIHCAAAVRGGAFFFA